MTLSASYMTSCRVMMEPTWAKRALMPTKNPGTPSSLMMSVQMSPKVRVSPRGASGPYAVYYSC